VKAVRFPEPKSLELIDIPAPTQVAPDEVLVNVHQVGICGTDYSGYLGRMPFFSYPRIWGHELGVEVVKCGANVSDLQPGDRCSVEPYMNNVNSFASQRNRGNCCNDLEVIGVHRDGGMCEQIVLPARKLHKGNQLQFDQLALVETLAIGYHAVERGNPTQDQTVVIVGAGPIGLAVLEFVKLRGCRCIMIDIQEERLKFCRDVLGVEHTILAANDGSDIQSLQDLTNGNLAQVVVDATGNNHSMAHALEFVSFTGTLVYVGISSQEVTFAHPLMHRREMTLMGSRNAMPGDFDKIIQLIADGKIDTKPWITHRTTIDSIIEDFPKLLDPAAKVLKAMVKIQ